MKTYRFEIGERVLHVPTNNIGTVVYIDTEAPASASNPLSNYPMKIQLEGTQEVIDCSDSICRGLIS